MARNQHCKRHGDHPTNKQKSIDMEGDYHCQRHGDHPTTPDWSWGIIWNNVEAIFRYVGYILVPLGVVVRVSWVNCVAILSHVGDIIVSVMALLWICSSYIKKQIHTWNHPIVLARPLSSENATDRNINAIEHRVHALHVHAQIVLALYLLSENATSRNIKVI